MNILLTGATGYIGQRLLPVLVEAGHTVVCCVRNVQRFHYNGPHSERVSVITGDFLKPETLKDIPDNIDAAYYLIHSMSASSGDFSEKEERSARHFLQQIEQTRARQIMYLSGIVNDAHLSKHLRSRKHVEDVLASGSVPLTTLRAGIIIGSGSASFEIIRDLVEKLPVMIAPHWLNNRCQPIAVRNVVQYLAGVALKPETFSRSFDIGGPDILSFKEMLLGYADVRHPQAVHIHRTADEPAPLRILAALHHLHQLFSGVKSGGGHEGGGDLRAQRHHPTCAPGPARLQGSGAPGF